MVNAFSDLYALPAATDIVFYKKYNLLVILFYFLKSLSFHNLCLFHNQRLL